MVEIYPWQQSQWQSMIQQREKGRMAHALLLSGQEDTGLNDFAMMLAKYMLCRHAHRLPCGQCKDCLLFAAGTHPDIMRVFPEKNQQIKIGQIRDLADFMGCHPHQGGYRIVIISPAERMNIYAANALLKSLEEPGDNTLLLLISSRTEQLLPTIVSRCQKVSFPLPDQMFAVKWLEDKLPDPGQARLILQMAHGRPLAAVRYAEQDVMEQWGLIAQGLESVLTGEQSITSVAKAWQSMESGFVLEWMLAQVAGIIRYKMTKADGYLTGFFQMESFVSRFASCPVAGLLKYHDWLIKVYGQITSHINISHQLLCEAMLIQWHNLLCNTIDPDDSMLPSIQ